MTRLQRITWFAPLLASGFLPLASCGGDYWTPTETEGERGEALGPVQPACTDWNAYDGDWHQRHCGERGIHWCNAPDAGPGSLATPDAGATTSADGGELPSTDGATTDTSTTATSQSGTAPDGGYADTGATTNASNTSDGGASTSCSVSTTCPVGTSCVTGSCQPCSDGVCVCQRDDDCPASQICDHTAGTCAAALPTCAMLTTEADCTARADCSAIYGGMSCTNAMGSPCLSGQADCTCATYSFAVCIARSP